jgi:serine/threonine protein phosphatase 1
MTATYVFPDLHGRLDHLKAALEAISATSEDTLVFLGDYIDRGLDSADVVKKIRELQEGRPNVICLSGNHEMMMLWGLMDGGDQLNGWIANGGTNTLASYTDAMGALDEATMAHDAEWFASLPMLHEDEHRVYVHAGVNPAVPLDKQEPRTLHWHRYYNTDMYGHGDKHIVHGHDPHKNGPVTFGNRTAMDVGAVWTGRYVVGVFDDSKPGGPVRVIEVTA